MCEFIYWILADCFSISCIISNHFIIALGGNLYTEKNKNDQPDLFHKNEDMNLGFEKGILPVTQMVNFLLHIYRSAMKCLPLCG